MFFLRSASSSEDEAPYTLTENITKPSNQSTKIKSTKPQHTTNNNNPQKSKRKFDEISEGGKGKNKGKGKEGNPEKKGKKEEEEEEQKEEKKVKKNFWDLNDNVKFGETADRPPTITVRPKKSLKMV